MSALDRGAQEPMRGARHAVQRLVGRSGVPVTGTVRDRMVTALVAPSARSGGGFFRAAASAFVAAGLVTLSWERFGNVTAGSYNVKLPVLLLLAAAVLALPAWFGRLRALGRPKRLPGAVLLLAGGIVLYFVARALAVSPLTVGLAQIASVLTGAVLPALAILGVVHSGDDVVWALRRIVAGAVLTGAFGLWQLFAFTTGLPQGVVYTGVGTSGVGGRIAAFSYEPAYFAYFILLAIGATIAVVRAEGRRVPWALMTFFALVLTLANVRALLFLAPLLAVLLLVDLRGNGRSLIRGSIAAAAVLAVTIVAPIGVQAVADLAAPDAAAVDRNDGPRLDPTLPSGQSGPTGEREEARRLAPPEAAPAQVLDPAEQSSNAPRLALYRATLRVDLAHPAVGVGPGGLRQALRADGGVGTEQAGAVVANNVWLQAAADGGVPLLLLEAALALLVVVLWWRSRRTALQPLLSGWVAVLLVGGMLTSYFFDIKVWVVLAIAVVWTAALHRTGEARP